MKPEINLEKLQSIGATLLTEIGEDPQREGLLKTPDRFARAMRDLTAGYHQNVEKIVNGAIFHEEYSEMVVVKNIEFYSMCEHHLLPFFGTASVAYIPNGKIIGLSKIPRIINMYSRRLQVQERLTDEIANAIQSLLEPKGVAVMLEAVHLCMMMRGVQVQSSDMVTSSMFGIFRDNIATRSEFMNIVKKPRSSRS